MSALEQDQDPDGWDDAFISERHAFLRLEPGLRARHAGEFVAVHGGRVVGHGVDDEALAQEMYERWGDAPFFIGRIGKDPLIYEIPSPESVH